MKAHQQRAMARRFAANLQAHCCALGFGDCRAAFRRLGSGFEFRQFRSWWNGDAYPRTETQECIEQRLGITIEQLNAGALECYAGLDARGKRSRSLGDGGLDALIVEVERAYNAATDKTRFCARVRKSLTRSRVGSRITR